MVLCNRAPSTTGLTLESACPRGDYQIQTIRHPRMRRLFAHILMISTGGLLAYSQSHSPSRAAAGFSKKPRPLPRKALLEDHPPGFVPPPPPPTPPRFPLEN